MIQQTRLVSGPHAGDLRISVTVDLCREDELAVARALGCLEQAEKNLDLPRRRRSIGPTANVVAMEMWHAMADHVATGRNQKRKRRSKAKR